MTAINKYARKPLVAFGLVTAVLLILALGPIEINTYGWLACFLAIAAYGLLVSYSWGVKQLEIHRQTKVGLQ